MITEGLMQLGEWDIQLKPTTPTEIKRLFKFGGNVMVTQTELRDHQIGRDALSAAALYVGIIWRKNLRKGWFGGAGMAGYLATGQGQAGKSGFELFSLSLPDTFDGIIGQMFTGGGYTNGIQPGTDFASTSTTVKEFSGFLLPPCKSALDTFAAQTGNEYRIYKGVIDYSAAALDSELFRVDPIVLIGPGLAGRDQGITALSLAEWDVERHIDNYRRDSFTLLSDGTSGSEGGAFPDYQTSHEIYYKWGNSSFLGYDPVSYFNEPQQIDSTDIDDSIALSSAIANRYALVQHEIKCSVTDPTARALLAAGDYVWVYDPYEGLLDLTNPVVFKGRTIHPIRLRMPGLTWPVTEGMGVYVYYDDTVTNVTRFVEFEDPVTDLEIGSLPLPLVPPKFASIVN